MKKVVYLLLLLTWACADLYVVPEDHYLIPAGKHESVLANGSMLDKLRTLKSDRLLFTARFDQSAAYDLQNDDQEDINKLFGFSEANSLHHENSARLGWRYSKDKDAVEIFSYVYQAGVRTFEYITDVKINQTVQYAIHIAADTYRFEVGEKSLMIDRTFDGDKGLYYLLFPYFGGDQVAPHDINIFIKEVF